ncbi:MAG: hypothetical protein ACAH80_06525 [Alphaproteobacteria bacterium]
MTDVIKYLRTRAFGGKQDKPWNKDNTDGMLTYMVYQQHADGGGHLFQRFKHYADNGARLKHETDPNNVYAVGGSMPPLNGGWGTRRPTLEEAVSVMFKYETESLKRFGGVSDLTPYTPILDADFKLAEHFAKSSGMDAIAQAAITVETPVKGMKSIKFKNKT